MHKIRAHLYKVISIDRKKIGSALNGRDYVGISVGDFLACKARPISLDLCLRAFQIERTIACL